MKQLQNGWIKGFIIKKRKELYIPFVVVISCSIAARFQQDIPCLYKSWFEIQLVTKSILKAGHYFLALRIGFLFSQCDLIFPFNRRSIYTFLNS